MPGAATIPVNDGPEATCGAGGIEAGMSADVALRGVREVMS